MISDLNTGGIKYLDGIKAANSLAWYLKNIERTDASNSPDPRRI